jgi:hypothetical protein
MRKVTLLAAAALAAVVTQANAGTLPVNKLDSGASSLVDTVALRVYVHEGRRYCFYFNGWHGPGWYRCGFAFRRGLGWGGSYGWNDWSYGPYERRFGHRSSGVSVGVEERSRSGTTFSRERSTSGTTFDTRTRSNTTTTGDSNVRTRSSTSGSATINERSNTGAKVQSGGTTGGANVQMNSSAKVQGGGQMEKSSGAPEKKPQQ